jgi:tRNA pseudouridine38-40 synthase
MRTIKLTLAYDGTAYAGWQRQLDRPTIQQTIEDVLSTLCGERITVFGSGRTDAGVHARGQVASFSTTCGLPVRAFQRALNVELPRDIAVLAAEEAAANFHAQKHAVSKRYRYEIHNSRTADVFRRKLAWHYCWGKLDAEAMHAAARHWLGKHDFRTFESRWPQRKTSVRTVLDIECKRLSAPDQKRIALEVEADGFLYNMVRTMVGTLIEVGRGRRPPEWAAEVLAVGDRREAGMKVPPHGLFLMHVVYAPTPAMKTSDE